MPIASVSIKVYVSGWSDVLDKETPMNKPWLSFLLSVSLCLVVISGWLLLTPTTVLAATCTADCEGGRSVSCTGTSCSATDSVGCSGTINRIVTETSCPKREELME